MIEEIDKKLSSFNSTEVASNEVINKLKVYQSIVASDPELATSELTSKISDLAASQVELITSGKAKANPNVLNLLDFSLDN